MIYFRYLRTVLRHKWYVFLECLHLGLPLIGIVHDWSKFLPDEFIPYARYFEKPRRDKRGEYDAAAAEDNDFLIAWLKHQRRSPHHWQYWILVQDEDDDKILPMSERYRKEMLADWRGAGRTYGNNDTANWYLRNKGKIQLHHDTRKWIESQILE
jgi:hypothetical protein